MVTAFALTENNLPSSRHVNISLRCSLASQNLIYPKLWDVWNSCRLPNYQKQWMLLREQKKPGLPLWCVLNDTVMVLLTVNIQENKQTMQHNLISYHFLLVYILHYSPILLLFLLSTLIYCPILYFLNWFANHLVRYCSGNVRFLKNVNKNEYVKHWDHTNCMLARETNIWIFVLICS